MSRVTLLQNLYMPKRSAFKFEYDALSAPRIYDILTPMDVQQLIKIATSLKYNGDIEKKYELIDEVMTARGFRRAHAGTNRVVYNFLELPTFVAKVAVDKVGMKDTPCEFKNQKFFKPFCCKIFEVDPSGVIGFVERVNPISSLEEFLSISDDIFNMMITKIIGKYVVDDLGSENYMNFGIRCDALGHTFGPVIIDYPYAYELDGSKLMCAKPIMGPNGLQPCGGGIDYDAGFNHLYCTKCGRKYKAMDLKNDNSDIVVLYDKTKGDTNMRARVIDGRGNVILDSGRSTDHYITREEYDAINTGIEGYIQDVDEEVYVKRFSKSKMKRTQGRNYERHIVKLNSSFDEEIFNPAIKADNKEDVDATVKADNNTVEGYAYTEPTVIGDSYGIAVDPALEYGYGYTEGDVDMVEDIDGTVLYYNHEEEVSDRNDEDENVEPVDFKVFTEPVLIDSCNVPVPDPMADFIDYNNTDEAVLECKAMATDVESANLTIIPDESLDDDIISSITNETGLDGYADEEEEFDESEVIDAEDINPDTFYPSMTTEVVDRTDMPDNVDGFDIMTTSTETELYEARTEEPESLAESKEESDSVNNGDSYNNYQRRYDEDYNEDPNETTVEPEYKENDDADDNTLNDIIDVSDIPGVNTNSRLVRSSEDRDVIYSTDETSDYIRAQYYEEDAKPGRVDRRNRRKKSYSKKFSKNHKPFNRDEMLDY